MTPNEQDAAIGPGAEVATYESLEGASEALQHLVEHGYDEQDVAIAPRGFRVIDRHELRRQLAQGLYRGGLAGAASVAAISAIFLLGLSQLTIVVAYGILGLFAGGALGLIVGAALYRYDRATSFEAPQDEVRPTRFAISVSSDAAAARHALARWWSPSARPARGRRRAA